MKLYVMKICVVGGGKDSRLPLDVAQAIMLAVRKIIKKGDANHSLEGIDASSNDAGEKVGWVDYSWEWFIPDGCTEERYAKRLASAIRAVPGCEVGGKYGVKIKFGWAKAIVSLEWIDGL